MIPKEVIEAARGRRHLGGTLQLVGKYRKQEVYAYIYTEPMTIGMPEVYLWDGKRAQIINEKHALDILNRMPI